VTRSPAEEFEALRRTVEQLRETVDARLADDPVREAAFDKLYGELKDYKEDFVRRHEQPLIRDLMMLYDSLHWFKESLLKQEMSPEVIADSFQFLVDELVEVLYRRDVVPMPKTESFDRAVHRAVKVLPAERAEDDNRIAQVLKRGFTQGTKTLRVEEVVVYKWRNRTGNTES
jgi:molecular chaperone GrpE (heat shock protein)